MLLRHLPLLTSLAWLVLQDSGAATEDSDDQDDPNATEDRDGAGDDASDALGDKGKAALDREREARKAADKRARDAEKRLADLEADAKKRADDEAAEQGKWKELAEKRDADLQETTGKLESLQSRLDEALKVITDDIAATWKDVPEEVRDLYDGADDDVLAKRKHLTRSAKLIARLTERKDTSRGNGPNPKPSDRSTTTEQDNRAKAAIRPRL